MSPTSALLLSLIITVAACGTRSFPVDTRPVADQAISDGHDLDLGHQDRDTAADARSQDRETSADARSQDHPMHPDLCPSPLAYCDGTCVDIMSSNDNCGACGKKCSGGESCLSAKCTCPSGLTACFGSCVDTNTDESNCGACGHQCAVGECIAGLCPDPSLVQVQVSCSATTLPVGGTTQCTAHRLLQTGAVVDITSDPLTNWFATMDPASPPGCAGLTIGYFSTTNKGEFHVANDSNLATLGCRALIGATFMVFSSNSITIKVK